MAAIARLAASASLVMALTSPALAQTLVGFSADGSARERGLESQFDAGLSASAIGERLKRMAALPNQVGSPHDKENAEYTLAQYKAWGWDAHIEVFNVLYPTPKNELLELVAPDRFVATLTEKPLDATSARNQGALPAYAIYGGDGDVAAPLIYVNYGMPADYDALQRMGLSVKGKIVIVRYGGGWRGLKPKLAAEHGAMGCIIYSDPADDGYGVGDVYPKGAFRPPTGIQRGSVIDLPVEAGDPLTPGYGATAEAPRIGRDQSKVILTIPVLPISYGDAEHFLAALTGPTAPKSWRGALPITYHVGSGTARAHLMVQSDWSLKPLYDVIAMIKGSGQPDQWVIRGNHRDGWVYGAQDPLAGQTATMEEARAIGHLAQNGWRPRRTIVYASWDGEEPGLLGSTEWAETHQQELQDKAILYVNSDTNDRGFLFADASYSAQALVNAVGAAVIDPETGVSVRDRAVAKLEVDATDPGADADLKARAKKAADGVFPVSDLGSGSDYTVFVQHLGIASINLGYRGEGQSGGVYHSAYDTFEHFARFGDPGFAYGVVLAKTGGRLVLRAADAELPPFVFSDFAAAVADQVGDLERLTSARREQNQTRNRLLDAKAYALAADPMLPSGPPDRTDAVPILDFAPLTTAVARLKASAIAYDRAAATETATASPDRLAAASALMQSVELAMTDPRGLPGRPWYRHLIYAPGLLTGYGAKTLPGVREAIEAGRWDEATDFIARTAEALDRVSAKLDQARGLLGG